MKTKTSKARPLNDQAPPPTLTPDAPAIGPAPGQALAQVKRRRRPWLWVVSVLLIALGALLVGSVVNTLKTTVPVVAAAQEILRGNTITVENLIVVEVNPDPGLRTIPAAELDSLVGQTAMFDIPQGSLVVPGSAGGEVVPQEGDSLVGVALTPPQMPSGGLKPGQLVQLVSTPRQGDDLTDTAAVISVEAVVVSTAPVQDTNLTVVNVTVAAEQAEQLVGLSATGRAALIVKAS